MKYIYIHVVVLSKVVAAESLYSNGIGGRMTPEPHYSFIKIQMDNLWIVPILHSVGEV
jgi:hypothetical protein